MTDSLEIGGETKQVNGNDDTRREFACFSCLLNLALLVSHIHVEGVFIDIDENRRRALHSDDLSRGKEGETRHKHGIAWLHVPSFEC